MGEREIKYWIHVLGDEVVGTEDKLEAVEELLGAGKDAIEPLIDRLLDAKKDARFLVETKVPTGPLHAAPETVLATSVRYMVETILYRIIAPQRRPREPKTRLDRLKPQMEAPDMRPPIPWVADWTAFWTAHKNESLADIKAWSAEEIDRRWQAIDNKKHQPVTPASLSTAGKSYPSALKPDELEKARAAYAKARALYLEARRDPKNAKKASDAKRSLTAAGATHALVKVHTDFMAQSLGSR